MSHPSKKRERTPSLESLKESASTSTHARSKVKPDRHVTKKTKTSASPQSREKKSKENGADVRGLVAGEGGSLGGGGMGMGSTAGGGESIHVVNIVDVVKTNVIAGSSPMEVEGSAREVGEGVGGVGGGAEGAVGAWGEGEGEGGLRIGSSSHLTTDKKRLTTDKKRLTTDKKNPTTGLTPPPPTHAPLTSLPPIRNAHSSNVVAASSSYVSRSKAADTGASSGEEDRTVVAESGSEAGNATLDGNDRGNGRGESKGVSKGNSRGNSRTGNYLDAKWEDDLARAWSGEAIDEGRKGKGRERRVAVDYAGEEAAYGNMPDLNDRTDIRNYHPDRNFSYAPKTAKGFDDAFAPTFRQDSRIYQRAAIYELEYEIKNTVRRMRIALPGELETDKGVFGVVWGIYKYRPCARPCAREGMVEIERKEMGMRITLVGLEDVDVNRFIAESELPSTVLAFTRASVRSASPGSQSIKIVRPEAKTAKRGLKTDLAEGVALRVLLEFERISMADEARRKLGGRVHTKTLVPTLGLVNSGCDEGVGDVVCNAIASMAHWQRYVGDVEEYGDGDDPSLRPDPAGTAGDMETDAGNAMMWGRMHELSVTEWLRPQGGTLFNPKINIVKRRAKLIADLFELIVCAHCRWLVHNGVGSWFDLDLQEVSVFTSYLNPRLPPLRTDFAKVQGNILGPSAPHSASSKEGKNMQRLAGNIDIEKYRDHATAGGARNCPSERIMRAEQEVLFEVGYQWGEMLVKLELWLKGDKEPTRSWLHRASEWVIDGAMDSESPAHITTNEHVLVGLAMAESPRIRTFHQGIIQRVKSRIDGLYNARGDHLPPPGPKYSSRPGISIVLRNMD